MNSSSLLALMLPATVSTVTRYVSASAGCAAGFCLPMGDMALSLTWQRSPSQTDTEIFQAGNKAGEGEGLSLWGPENNLAGKPELGFRHSSGPLLR